VSGFTHTLIGIVAVAAQSGTSFATIYSWYLRIKVQNAADAVC
jgi:hypothetical protein